MTFTSLWYNLFMENLKNFNFIDSQKEKIVDSEGEVLETFNVGDRYDGYPNGYIKKALGNTTKYSKDSLEHDLASYLANAVDEVTIWSDRYNQFMIIERNKD